MPLLKKGRAIHSYFRDSAGKHDALKASFDALHVVVFKIVVDAVRGCRARTTWRRPCGARSAATLSAEAAYVSLTGMDRERVKMRRLVKVKMVRRVTWADGE
jgi:hypothetical protein